ncbi:MAG: hydroxymethylglutaryl-CoA lyase [Halobacteriovorax sp.]|nr:hydroxymethylglutaryl-CoA lyase [Halobacteriovorax sp.]|tara:strand:- start:21496 stop:22413 length:918 start_codon:yes stop_codon:yes gene_type:complete
MFKNLPKSIHITEVGPRDGLQNEKKVLSTEDKISFILMLQKAGLKSIEATSFVRPDRIPQMGDASELYEGLMALTSSKVEYPCLIPNIKGLEKALEAGVKEIALFTATSEEFNKKNINASIDESFVRMEEVAKKAISSGLKVRGYVSTVFGCPYEAETSIKKLIEVSKRLQDLGAYDISLGDTIGVGVPLQVAKIINELEKNFDLGLFSMHFHDTKGMALSNVLTSIELGITKFDSSAGGLGGCPYAKGATGNLATEDLVYLCHSLGIETGVDMELLASASEFILSKLGHASSSKYLTAYLAGKK